MSRFLCPYCDHMNHTTAYPNEIEGYFVSDVRASNVRGVSDLEDWLNERAARAYRCEHCGVVTIEEEAPSDRSG